MILSPKPKRLWPISCAITSADSRRVKAAKVPRLQPPKVPELTTTTMLVASGAKRSRMLIIRGIVRSLVSIQQCDQIPVPMKPQSGELEVLRCQCVIGVVIGCRARRSGVR